MKHSFLMLLTFMSVISSSGSSCSKDVDNNNNTVNNNTMTNGKIKITVNSQTFTASLFDNNSAKAFKEMLPLTIHMTELNGNEKYYDLPKSIPTNAFNPETIKSGDLMLYDSKILVLFYKTFSTSYSYTKLGMIDDVKGLELVLGSGNATVTFELE
jgi:hypothetical protein